MHAVGPLSWSSLVQPVFSFSSSFSCHSLFFLSLFLPLPQPVFRLGARRSWWMTPLDRYKKWPLWPFFSVCLWLICCRLFVCIVRVLGESDGLYAVGFCRDVSLFVFPRHTSGLRRSSSAMSFSEVMSGVRISDRSCSDICPAMCSFCGYVLEYADGVYMLCLFRWCPWNVFASGVTFPPTLYFS